MLLQRFATAQDLLSLNPEELGGALLAMMHEDVRADEQWQRMSGMRASVQGWSSASAPDRLLMPLDHQPDPVAWPRETLPQVRLAVMEGWCWLLSEGFIVPNPDGGGRGHVITRQGMALRTEEDVKRHREDGMLPVGLLHPQIADEVRSLFSRGHYDTVVFHAFREVEIVLRHAVQGEAHWTGKEVVKAAFNPSTGLLRDTAPEVPDSQRVAEFALFDGAIGCLKNPGSHRRPNTSRRDAARLAVFASYLLTCVDERIAALPKDGA